VPRIAISYRRSDAQDITGRIFDRLAARYGREAVFRDIDNIRPGLDFRDQILEALSQTDVLLAIVGPYWLGPSRWKSRISDEADPVRIEVETAMKRGIPVIPVLVGGMQMPSSSRLPASLNSFVYRHAVTVDGGMDFDVHIGRLCRDIDRIFEDASARRAAAPSAIKSDSSVTPESQKAAPERKPEQSAESPEIVATAQDSEHESEQAGEPGQAQDRIQDRSDEQLARDLKEEQNRPIPAALESEVPQPPPLPHKTAPQREASRPPVRTAAASGAHDNRQIDRVPSAASRKAISKPLLVSGIGLVAAVAVFAVYLSKSPNVVPDAPTKATGPAATTPMAAPTAMAPAAAPPKAPASVATSPSPPPPAAGNSATAGAIPNLPAQTLADDRARLLSFDQARADAITQATKGADNKTDLDDLTSVLAGAAIPINAKALTGDWRCRTLKLGGGLNALVIYGFFKCNISAQGDALIFQKVSGSQRTRGNLYRLSDTRYVYLGAGTVNDDPPIAYGSAPQEDEVAYLVQVAPNRLRLEFPKPHYESDFDIIDLRR
jgi:Domain of unknown function (DUF4893)/TIR domain